MAIPAITFVVLFPVGVFAQPTYGADRDVPSVASWRHLEQLSVQLERQADRARAEAKADQRHRGSEEFAERLDDFAKEAHRFRALVNERGVPSSKINDELRKLVDGARKVQRESARAERHDSRTDADWNQTLATLDQINNQYLAANGLSAPLGDRDRRDDQSSRRRYEANDQLLPGAWSDDHRALLKDLGRQADDAARLSESARLEITPDIERLRDQLRSFEQDAPRLAPDDTRANVEQMLSEARAAQADLSGSNAPPRLRDDVDGIVNGLGRMRDSTLAVGTSGYGPGPAAIGTSSRYATMDAAQLSSELDARLARISAFVGQAGSDDVSNRIAQFSDRVRDFDGRAARMSPEDRREAVNRLLQDAQKTQRDLASRHVSTELMNQWNDVVNLLVHLRDRS